MSARRAAGADILAPGQRKAIEALGGAWGSLYDIGYSRRDGVFYAVCDDGTGEALEAATADALDAAIRADQAREVTR